MHRFDLFCTVFRTISFQKKIPKKQILELEPVLMDLSEESVVRDVRRVLDCFNGLVALSAIQF